jgi:hypothetical protein
MELNIIVKKVRVRAVITSQSVVIKMLVKENSYTSSCLSTLKHNGAVVYMHRVYPSC